MPSKEVFSAIKFSSSILEKRIRELAFLNKGICITLFDQTLKKEKEFVHKYLGGIAEFVKHINNKKPILVNKNEKEVFKKPIFITATKNNVIVECSSLRGAQHCHYAIDQEASVWEQAGQIHHSQKFQSKNYHLLQQFFFHGYQNQ